MKIYEFTIVASGLDPEARDFADRFFEAGCDDATISFQKGVIVLEFAREAPNFIKALASALFDVQRAGARVERIEPDHLVSMADIAKRAGLTRAAISLYAKGMRAQEFPAPIARVTSESPLWDWYAVARWMCRYESKVSLQDVLQARMVKETNLLIVQGSLPHDRFTRRLGGKMLVRGAVAE
jgi:transcriptional regulator with XRE-family HTH domain